jgi:uroporphyrinogen decarboxylase
MPNEQDEKLTPVDGAMLRTLRGEALPIPPIWLMRQAGRYLPEYRATRTQANGFLNLCYNPELATEVTMQPIRRYDFDAAILFSDILVVPHALGQEVWFVEGEGPRLTPLETAADLAQLDLKATTKTFDIVCEAVTRIRTALSPDKALIGFCGAPWTVATYMVAGRGTPDQAPTRLLAYKDPALFVRLIDLLVETSIAYLSRQISAGVNIVQIFDSWAGSLPDDQLQLWVVEPTRRIVTELKARHPEVPIIGFPRAAGTSAVHYHSATGVDAIGCDTAMSLDFMRQTLRPTGAVLQGNLDPLLLVAGGERLQQRVGEILAAMKGHPFVFNLGHGIVPQTPPEHVARLVELVRSHGK